MLNLSKFLHNIARYLIALLCGWKQPASTIIGSSGQSSPIWGSLFQKLEYQEWSPTGGILTAFLFSCYIDNILKRVAAENIGCRKGISKVTPMAYADDIALERCPHSWWFKNITKCYI